MRIINIVKVLIEDIRLDENDKFEVYIKHELYFYTSSEAHKYLNESEIKFGGRNFNGNEYPRPVMLHILCDARVVEMDDYEHETQPRML